MLWVNTVYTHIGTLITLNTGTDGPEQTEDLCQIMQKAAPDLSPLFATHPALF